MIALDPGYFHDAEKPCEGMKDVEIEIRRNWMSCGRMNKKTEVQTGEI